MKNRKLYLVAALLTVVLLAVAIVVPTLASTSAYSFGNVTFDNWTLNGKGESALGGFTSSKQSIPSKGSIVIDPADPTGTNRVFKYESAVEASGALGYDAVLYSSALRQITWQGQTVNSAGETVYYGTFAVDNATYYVESADKITCRVLDQRSTSTLAVTSGKITYNTKTVTITEDTVDSYDYFGANVRYGYFKLDGVLYRVKSEDGFGTCIVMDKYAASYKIYNDKATSEAINGNTSGNIDRNLVPNHSEMSYKSYEKVVMQAEYYIPDGGLGIFESQHIGFTSTEHSAGGWLGYYRINIETGVLSPEFEGGSDITLEKNVWNTVSMVINLVTGDLDFYVNNVYHCSGYLYKGQRLTNVTLTANQWNVAKLMKNATAPDNYQGSIYIDDVVCHSYVDGMDTTFSAADNAAGEPAVWLDVTTKTGRVVGAAPSSRVLCNEGVSAQTVYLSKDMTEGLLAPVPGASIRLTNSSGIRFATQVNTEKLEALKALADQGKVKSVEIGTLIVPTSRVTEAGAFTVEALEQLNYSAKYLDVKANIGHYFTVKGFALDEGFDKTFVGSIINIRHGNIARLFSGMGYVRITLNDGSEKYIYGYDYDTVGATALQDNYSRSIRQIASIFVNDPAFAQYQTILQSFVDGTTVMNLSSSIVKNAEYSSNTFYFQNAAGVSMRLTYDGNNGWRLQAAKPTQSSAYYNDFDNMGAAQSLALYMGEGYNDVVKDLTVTTANGVITIGAEDTETYVTLNTTGSFNLQFFSADGTLMNNVTSVTADGKNVVMKGDLLENEAIYGGGERFDSANKRGKAMSLYSYDAYNGGGKDSDGNFKGTYTVIPLFTSSRGSGMFINRYEIMNVDWGRASANQWSVNLENDLMDVYFYSTGKMTDAIKGYTDLSGHATLPEEWAQGVLICRYSPDFGSLEGETMVYKTLTEIPGYESLLATAGGTQTAYEKWVANGNTFAKGTYIYSGELIKYLYVDTDGDGSLEFIRTTKKGNPSGAGVKAIVQGLIDAGMKPDAMVLEGIGWMNISNGTASAMKNLENLKEVLEWLDEQGIRTTLYMAVGNIDPSMVGYKPEYHVHADVVTTVTQETVSYRPHSYGAVGTYETLNTTSIPKSAASDNPDAFGSGAMDYLDITNPEALEWYMDIVWGQLIDLGVDGCKIDFCEIMPNGSTVSLTAKNALNGRYEEVATTTITYKWYDPTVFENDEVHHAYSSYFISAFMKSMLEQKEEKNIPDGFVALSRGGGIGSQRNPYMWGGDQARTEVNLTTQLLCVLNSGISGIPFMTYDMAGYAYAKSGYYYGMDGSFSDPEGASDTEAKIFLRAIQYTTFGTMIQTHGDVRHAYELKVAEYAEGYTQTVIERYTQLHYELMPYLQKYSQIACDTGIPVVRHMVLNYQNDANVYNMDDQFMFGDALMVAPILELESYNRDVYLPEGNWMNLLTGEIYKVGAEGMTIPMHVFLDQIAVFMNLDSEDVADLLPVFNGENWQAINRGVEIEYEVPVEPEEPPHPGDVYEDDIFY